MVAKSPDYKVCIRKDGVGVRAGAPHKVTMPYPAIFKQRKIRHQKCFRPFWVNEPWFFEGWTLETCGPGDASVIWLFPSFKAMEKGAPKTSMKPGKFLKKFYGHALSDAEIQSVVARYSYEVSGEILFAETEEDICRVYATGPRSCMSGRYKFEHNPMKCYASPDLCVAYLADKDGKPTHRAVVWREKKEYARVYGPDIRLQAAFDLGGWKKTNLHGARLNLVPGHGNGCRSFRFPYFDVKAYVILSQCKTFATFQGTLQAGDFFFQYNDDGFGQFIEAK